MASWQAHLFDLVARLMIKRRMKTETDYLKVRAVLSGGSLPAPHGARFTAATLGGIAGEWAESDTPACGTLLYLHGGGYIACSPQTHRPVTGAYALAGFRVFAADYRLAPENPYPAAVNDAEAVYRALQAVTDGPIVISGESAGGGLCLALMLRLRAHGVALPAGAALFSPWTDLAGTGTTISSNEGREAMLWGPGVQQGAALYLGGADAHNPEASPLYGDMAGFPPLLIHVGDREILRDDATRLADRATAAGVHAQLQIWPVVSQAWQLAQSFMPEARQSVTQAAMFLHKAGWDAAIGKTAERIAAE